MALRRPSIGSLERELGALRESIAATEREQLHQAELAEAATAEKRAVAEDPAARDAAEKRVVEHRRERDRLSDVLELRREALASLERHLASARYRDAHAALESAAERRQSASSSLSKALAAAISALPALEAARDEVDAALAGARELLPSDTEFELPENADEVPFPDGVDRLLELVQAGPRRPLASTAAAIGKARAEREKGEASRIAPAVTEALELGLFDRIRALPPRQLPNALAFAERRRDIEVARLTKGMSDAPHAGASTRTADVVEAINRRVEKIRALVAEAEQVDAAAV